MDVYVHAMIDHIIKNRSEFFAFKVLRCSLHIIELKLNDVLRIKDHHKEELEKVQRLMDDSDKEASRSQDEITALDAKHGELELKAAELRKKLEERDDGLKR